MKRLSLFLVLLFLLTPFACSKPSEEDRVKQVIRAVGQAAEEKAIGDILAVMSVTYRDPQGHDREGIKGLLAFYFFRHRTVSVFIPDIDVRVDNAAAQAGFQAVITGMPQDGQSASLLPEALGVYDFTVVLAREGKEWKVTSAAWKRVGDAPLP